MIVYRPDGVAEEKEPCDARECIANCGYTMTPKADAGQDVIVAAPKRGRPAATALPIPSSVAGDASKSNDEI